MSQSIFLQSRIGCCVLRFCVPFQVEGWCPKKSWTKSTSHKYVEPEMYVSGTFAALRNTYFGSQYRLMLEAALL